jgi:hypothetical protein
MLMKRAALIVVLFTCIAVLPLTGQAESDFVLNVLPASLLINIDSGDFGVREGGGRTSLSDVYVMPNVAAGIGLELEDVYVDLTGGAGIIVNDSFQSFLLQAIASANW